ncbi:MAG TPA: adenosylcobinamide-GDP ribazoletransferase [Candidatus Limnocylindria bacterium]|nr:adenosylcobinamide-GDP ribazoletransferase [Candidatus Limnocylindria bacterium]
MRTTLAASLAAFGFLTILPTPRADMPRTAFARSVGYFPLVGAALGLVVGALDAMALRLVPASVASALDLVALAALSGGLHLDGLADSADGMLGARTREDRLAVMRDSRIGAFGAAAVALILLVEYAALSELRGGDRLAALVTGSALARWAMALALRLFPYARQEGLGLAFKDGLGTRDPVLATALAALVAFVVSGAGAPLAIAVAAVVAVGLGRGIAARLGGLTGDSYGAIGEIAFATLLVSFIACQRP